MRDQDEQDCGGGLPGTVLLIVRGNVLTESREGAVEHHVVEATEDHASGGDPEQRDRGEAGSQKGHGDFCLERHHGAVVYRGVGWGQAPGSSRVGVLRSPASSRPVRTPSDRPGGAVLPDCLTPAANDAHASVGRHRTHGRATLTQLNVE